MSIEIHYGDVTLLDSLGKGPDRFDLEHDWQIAFEEAFRAAQKYGRGQGGASLAVRFRLLSQHTSLLESVNWRQCLYEQLHGSDKIKPRDLWYLDTGYSPVPFGFGMALARPPRFVDSGHDGTYYIVVTEYDFVAGLLAYGGQVLTPATVPARPTCMPNLWLPNDYGMVLRRTTDDAWIRVTWDMSTNQPIFDDLGGDPGATNYETVASDCEWSAANRSFGFYTTGVYRLIGLADDKSYSIGAGTAATDFATGYTMSKGLIFADGKGPIVRSPNNYRLKMTIDGDTQIAWETL